MRGEAGRRGEEVRSDLWVAVEGTEGGGVSIDLRSKVEVYYGDATRGQVNDVLAGLGVRDAKVEIDDRGALPFAIGARVEAAARRAGLVSNGTAARSRPAREPSARDRLRRSRLYLPGNEPKYMISAGLHGPDGVILDLEDSVHADEKDAARYLVRDALLGLDFGDCERMVRINQGALGQADLDVIVPAAPDLLLLPKIEDPEELRAVDERIDAIQKDAGLQRPLWIMPIIETALGVERAFELASCSERVVALTMGLEDLTTDLGVQKTLEGEETLYARGRVVNAARAAGLQAIDSVFGDVGDMEGLADWGRRSRGLGFEGMGCIHPSQIEVIHTAYAPTEAELERALKIVAAFDEAQAAGLGVVSLGSKMVDPPVVERALKLVARARRMGLDQ